jgi:hypothetical protein
MATLEEDVAKYIQEVGGAVDRGEAWEAFKHLAKLGGELSGFLAICYVAFSANVFLSSFLPAVGLGFLAGGTTIAITRLASMYLTMGTEDRKSVVKVVGWLYGTPIGVKVLPNNPFL